jgi:hypothetical protein
MPEQWYQGLVALIFVAGGSLTLVRERRDPSRRSRLALVLSLWVAALWLAFGVHAIGPKHFRLFGNMGDRGIEWYLGAKFLLLGVPLILWFGAWILSLREALLDRWP